MGVDLHHHPGSREHIKPCPLLHGTSLVPIYTRSHAYDPSKLPGKRALITVAAGECNLSQGIGRVSEQVTRRIDPAATDILLR